MRVQPQRAVGTDCGPIHEAGRLRSRGDGREKHVGVSEGTTMVEAWRLDGHGRREWMASSNRGSVRVNRFEPAARVSYGPGMRNPLRYFKTSPEFIRLAVMMYVRFPLSLRQVEDLLHERGVDISHETVRVWWNRFGPMFAAEIRRRCENGGDKLVHGSGGISQPRAE